MLHMLHDSGLSMRLMLADQRRASKSKAAFNQGCVEGAFKDAHSASTSKKTIYNRTLLPNEIAPL